MTDSEAQARRRLVEAVEEIRAASRDLGMKMPNDNYATTRTRAQAWFYRVDQLLNQADRRAP